MRGAALAAGDAAQAQRQPDVVGGVRPGHQGRLLEHEADLAAVVLAGPRPRPLDRAAGRLGEARHDAQRRRLAAAGGAEKGDELARADVEVEPGERRRAVGEGFANAAQGDQGRRRFERGRRVGRALARAWAAELERDSPPASRGGERALSSS